MTKERKALVHTLFIAIILLFG